jgi:hypothetical protein
VYLDDVIVFANSLEEHNRRLDIVLQRLKDAGVKLNVSKCHFLQETATMECAQILRKSKRFWSSIPSDVSSAFLGCAGYYRHFVPHFAEIASPFSPRNFPSDKRVSKRFLCLKHHLTTSPVLAYPPV